MAARRWVFIREFFRRQRQIGSLWPSTPYLGREMAWMISTRPQGLRVLEVGPGVGPVTEQIIHKLDRVDALVLVELNPHFCEILREKAREWRRNPKCPQLEIIEGDVLVYQSEKKFDAIVSALPLTNFPSDWVARVFDQFGRLLVPGGTVSYFEYLIFRKVREWAPQPALRARMRALTQLLDSRTQGRILRKKLVLFSLPPANVTHVRWGG
jgi:phosphatidylserine decarboxylase